MLDDPVQAVGYRKLAAEIKRHEGWKLLIVKRSDRAFKIVVGDKCGW